MNYLVIEKNQKKYLECAAGETQLHTEQDALELIGACGEQETDRILLHAAVLCEDFFNLKTGLAGQILQKFVNYRVKVAVVIPSEQKLTGKFREFVAESNQGTDFRVFKSVAEAEQWLLNSSEKSGEMK